MATSKNTRQPTGHIAPFGLRLQPELKARAEEFAARYGRSLNAEIAHVLESYYDQHDRLDRQVDDSVGADDVLSVDHLAPKFLTENLPALHPSIPVVLTADETNMISALMQEQIKLLFKIATKEKQDPVEPIEQSKPRRVSRTRPTPSK